MKYETRLIWVLTITVGFVFLDRNAAGFLMPSISNDLHLSIITVCAVVGGMLALFLREAAPIRLARSNQRGAR